MPNNHFSLLCFFAFSFPCSRCTCLFAIRMKHFWRCFYIICVFCNSIWNRLETKNIIHKWVAFFFSFLICMILRKWWILWIYCIIIVSSILKKNSIPVWKFNWILFVHLLLVSFLVWLAWYHEKCDCIRNERNCWLSKFGRLHDLAFRSDWFYFLFFLF